MPKDSGVPPLCNTGVQSTTETGLRVLIDWVQCTIKKEIDLKEVIELLGMKEEDFLETNGLYSYSKCLYHDGIYILYAGTEEMGIHIQFTGHGCRVYEEKNKKTWAYLFGELLVKYDANFTRLDIAIDDFKGYFTLQQVINKIKKGEVVSRFKRAKGIVNWNIGSGEERGKTIYFGSSASMIQIRMYEKNYEREEAGNQLNVDFWNRTEIQLREERAETLANLIAADYYAVMSKENEKAEEQIIGEYAKGILKNYIRFVIKEKDTNKSRWKICKWWADFLGEVERLKLSEKAPDRSVEKTKIWIEKQVAPSLAVLDIAMSKETIEAIVTNGKTRLSEKHVKMLQRFLTAEEENPPQKQAEG